MSLRVVFMGTPDFAAVSLKALLDEGFEVAAVFTQPDKPRDRGMKNAFSPVKALTSSPSWHTARSCPTRCWPYRASAV